MISYYCICLVSGPIIGSSYQVRASQVVLVVKNLPANAGDISDISLIPGLERSHGGGHGNPSSVLFYFLFLYRILLFAIKAQHESAISIHIGPPF